MHSTQDANDIFGSDIIKDSIVEPDDLASLDLTDGNFANVWTGRLSSNVTRFLKTSSNFSEASLKVGQTGEKALNFFLQANVTGPPLEWSPQQVLFGSERTKAHIRQPEIISRHLKDSLSVDGEAIYRLTPHVELFVFARCLILHPALQESSEIKILELRLRINTWHQRLLSSPAPSLQNSILQDLDQLYQKSESALTLIEGANIRLLHGLEAQARNNLEKAKQKRGFEYILTGRLGKRTKFQETAHSQLVVIARSRSRPERDEIEDLSDQERQEKSTPAEMKLDDDTLLNRIKFSSEKESPKQDENLPPCLKGMDPANQPQLEALDSIILLILASSISNTSPEDGLTREETLPYAERVLNGDSPNWQVYTQALLVRSRIEGYKSRTIERGILQLQALVDQVIADTDAENGQINGESKATTFLPRQKKCEAAPAEERLRYIHQLGCPFRWQLEAELAHRWVSMGGLRTALEIYERLEMWAEVALCWAASNEETKARAIIREQLYTVSTTDNTDSNVTVSHSAIVKDAQMPVERSPLPSDAPRLFCILGDLEDSPVAYKRAWTISGCRYARAQRSLGKYYSRVSDMAAAAEAYRLALKIDPQNHATWFALGCVGLQIEDWNSAAVAFRRAVQIDSEDAESWSNLAIALLKASDGRCLDQSTEARQANHHDSFVALKRAAALKRESFRIWQNLLAVSVKLRPLPLKDIVLAQSRLIELLGPKEGENCVETPIMEALLNEVVQQDQVSIADNQKLVANGNGPGHERHGLEKMIVDLITQKVAPLITTSRRLWMIVARLSIHLSRPQAALNAYEKAWRTRLVQPGWDNALGSSLISAPQADDGKAQWAEVVDATIVLVDAYESLGMQTRESLGGGLGGGETLVAKDWRFKARSALRSVIARGKEAWGNTEDQDADFARLLQRMEDLKT